MSERIETIRAEARERGRLYSGKRAILDKHLSELSETLQGVGWFARDGFRDVHIAYVQGFVEGWEP